ncbi:transcriptional regulator ATRX-like isoform X15 [Scleropages formosus]|uniref:transcriptional regulator ATRX-like isoform X15 n=1 Tax=Scleropages formosus TaxID=113540 RepID=UPI0010FA9A88|nr:transcriptional regulator ATRX-like isoform X15 [Scleropages formosus]
MEEQLFKYIHTLFILTPLVFGEMYRRPKEGVSLTPALKGPFEELLWKYNENKVAEYRAGDGINVFGQFKGRATLNTKTGQLMVRDLRKADSGRYTAEVLMSGTMQDSSFDVKVIDAVTRPTVQCEQRDSVGILRCHSEGEMGQYRWEGPNDLLRNWTDQPIELQVSSSDSAYTCVVKNPVSEESSETFPAEHCFKGLFAHHGAVAAVVILVSVVLSVSGFLIGAHCMRRNSRRNGLRCDHVGKKDEETGLLQHYEVTEKNRELCSQNPSEDDGKTVGHIDSPAETQEKEGEKVAEVEEKVENRVSEMNTDSSNRKETHLGGQTVGRSDSPAETNEKEGEKEMDKKQNRVSDLKSDETTKTLQADTTIAEGSEMNSENNGNETMEQNIPEVTDVDTMEGKGSAGESSTNQKTAETENLDQNDTQTGTDVTQSAGDTDGETQSEHRDTVSVPGGEDAVEENRGKTGERPSDEDLFGEPVSERKKRFEPPACSPNNVKHERRSIQRKDKTSETEAKVDEQKDKDTDQEPRAAERSTKLRSQNTSEDDKKTEGHIDSAAEIMKKEGEKVTDEKQESRVPGECSTNQQTAETGNLDQNDTQTGTDVTRSAGHTSGGTQSEHGDTGGSANPAGHPDTNSDTEQPVRVTPDAPQTVRGDGRKEEKQQQEEKEDKKDPDSKVEKK